jgi:hypothetical protein
MTRVRVWVTGERAVLQVCGPGAGHFAAVPDAQHVRAVEANRALKRATAVVDPEAVRLAMAATIPPPGAGADEPYGSVHGRELGGHSPSSSRSLRRRRDV